MSLLKYYCLNIFDSNYIRKARVCQISVNINQFSEISGWLSFIGSQVECQCDNRIHSEFRESLCNVV